MNTHQHIRPHTTQWYGWSLVTFMLILLMTACDRKPFVEHKVKFTEKPGGCAQQQTNISMVSNFGGERFEFEKCLPSGYDDNLVRSERKGDTIIVRIPSIADAYPKTLYTITLDIDAYPRYQFIDIDGEVIQIAPAAN